MESSPVSNDRIVWMRRDIERQFGFEGSRYTRVGSVLPFVIAVAVTVAFFGTLLAIGSNPWVDMFIKRGWTPLVIVMFSLWSLMILLLKRSKLRLQRRALKLTVIPDDMDFVLSIDSVDQVIQRLYEVSDDPKRFVLLHRIDVGLSNVRNLSRVVDLGEMLRTQSEHDESVMETSFNLIRGLVWAIPILGFIGTVSGLSGAIGGFGRVLSQTDDPSQLIDALKGVTGGLSTAFETTLLALIAALLVQMLMTFQKKREEEFLDECTEYCQREVLSRLGASGAGYAEVAMVPAAQPQPFAPAVNAMSSPELEPVRDSNPPTPPTNRPIAAAPSTKPPQPTKKAPKKPKQAAKPAPASAVSQSTKPRPKSAAAGLAASGAVAAASSVPTGVPVESNQDVLADEIPDLSDAFASIGSNAADPLMGATVEDVPAAAIIDDAANLGLVDEEVELVAEIIDDEDFDDQIESLDDPIILE